MEFQLHGPRALATFVPEEEMKEERKEIPGTYSSPDSASDSECADGSARLGLTENKAATYIASGSRCLDFFFQVVPGESCYVDVKKLLSKAWKEDALMALKLIFQLRGVRGTGKSDKSNFYKAACWLYEHHPATLAANIPKVPKAGYYKDLLELLRRLLETPEESTQREVEKATHKSRKLAGKSRQSQRQARKKWLELQKLMKEVEKGGENMEPKGGENTEKADEKMDEEVQPAGDESMDEENEDEEEEVDDGSESEEDVEFPRSRRRFRRTANGYFHRKGAAARAAMKEGTLKPKEERIAKDLAKGKADKESAALKRKDKQLKLAKRVVEKHRTEPKFAAVYNAVAELFARDLTKDLEALNKDGRKARISFAAKWCPSLDSSYDRDTLLCEAVACMLFPKSSPEFEALEDHHLYVSIVRDKLRKEFLVPLRNALELPEVYMSAQAWESLPYRRVTSVAMKRYKELFLKHDEGRFKKYLDKVESGKSKIAAGALLPHEILMDAVKESKGDGARVPELQWKAMVEEMKQKGLLSSSLSICDVSGSMSGTPMEVCIALGMLTAELSEEPWKGKVITFSADPVLHTLKGETLKEKYEFTSRMPWMMNTDFQKVFDRLLETAQEEGVSPDRMVKRVFVFSDMEFDAARSGGNGYGYGYGQQEAPRAWDTDYMQICRKYREAGYGSPPQIVFWNLRATRSTPTSKDQPGVALVSGFSKNLLKMFMENDGAADPMFVLKQAVSGEFYDELVVVD